MHGIQAYAQIPSVQFTMNELTGLQFGILIASVNFFGCRLDELMDYIPDKFPTTGENLIIDDHGNRKKK